MSYGIFGVMGEVWFLDELVVEFIMEYCFVFVCKLVWWNVDLWFGYIDVLINSFEEFISDE